MRSEQEIRQELAMLRKSRDQSLDLRIEEESKQSRGWKERSLSYKAAAQEEHKIICALQWVLGELDYCYIP